MELIKLSSISCSVRKYREANVTEKLAEYIIEIVVYNLERFDGFLSNLSVNEYCEHEPASPYFSEQIRKTII